MPIALKSLSFFRGEKRVLNDISLDINDGTYVFLLGANGSGKTTLLRCIMNHLSPESGTVLIDGKPVQNYSSRELAKKLAYIPQYCYPAFNYSVLDLTCMGRTAHLSAFDSPRKSDYELAMSVLDELGIAHLAQKGVHNISGGELRLCIIARALVQESTILIMDEPTSGLDYGKQIELLNLVRRLVKDGKTVVQSTHNPQFVLSYADNAIAIKDGALLVPKTFTTVLDEETILELYGIGVNISNGVIIPKENDKNGA